MSDRKFEICGAKKSIFHVAFAGATKSIFRVGKAGAAKSIFRVGKAGAAKSIRLLFYSMMLYNATR